MKRTFFVPLFIFNLLNQLKVVVIKERIYVDINLSLVDPDPVFKEELAFFSGYQDEVKLVCIFRICRTSMGNKLMKTIQDFVLEQTESL